MKKLIKMSVLLLVLSLLLSLSGVSVCATNKAYEMTVAPAPAVNCRSAILIEARTGQILYEQNADEALPPASVTKIMTLLLVMEAIEAGQIKYTDMVTASANACSMGGSQIYLKEGEQMSVEDMIKSVVIASANDAAVALAEHIAGSEDAFVELMNERAKALGMVNTNFQNTNGLDDTADNHVTSARDISIMSRELIKHKKITEYSSIWMDTVRDGQFCLTNTNRLVRFYKGATGLKTGSTSKAGFCISATAERNGMSLICVIMAAQTRDIRNGAATALLDWGFSNHSVYEAPDVELKALKVVGGKKHSVELDFERFVAVIDKSSASKVKYSIELPENITAPIKKGDPIGNIKYTVNEEKIGSVDIFAKENIGKISFLDVLLRLFCAVSIN